MSVSGVSTRSPGLGRFDTNTRRPFEAKGLGVFVSNPDLRAFCRFQRELGPPQDQQRSAPCSDRHTVFQ